MANPQALYDDLVEAAYGSAAQASWTPFLSAYVRAFPHSRTALAIFDSGVNEVNVVAWANYDDAAIAAYSAYYHKVNPWVAINDQPGLGVVRARSVVPLDQILSSEFYADFLSKHGDVADGFGTKLAADETSSFVIASNYRLHDEAAGEAQIAIVQRLAPHLVRAHDLQRRLKGLQLRALGFDTALNRLGVAAYIVDGACQILAANSRGETLLRDRAAAGAGTSGTLRLSAWGSRWDAVAAEVRKASLIAGAAPAYVPLALGEDRPAFAEVAPLVLEDAPAGPRPVLVTVTASAPGAPDAALLREALGLTAAEARLAAAIGRGERLKDYSRRNGLAYETVRGQLKSIFQKTETGRQAELASLVARLLPH